MINGFKYAAYKFQLNVEQVGRISSKELNLTLMYYGLKIGKLIQVTNSISRYSVDSTKSHKRVSNISSDFYQTLLFEFRCTPQFVHAEKNDKDFEDEKKNV